MKSKPPNKRARLDPSPSSNSPSAKSPSASIKTESPMAIVPLAPPGSPPRRKQLQIIAPYQDLANLDLKEFIKIMGIISNPEAQLPIEDLDVLQNELETLLCSLALRESIIEMSLEVTKNSNPTTPLLAVKLTLGDHYDASHQEKINAIKNIMDSGHGTRTSVSAAAKLVMGDLPILTPISAMVTSRKSNNSASAAAIGPIKLQPKKKLKMESVGGKRNERPAPRGAQNRTHSIGAEDSSRHEVPNQFWEFTDQYCRNIATEDLDKLEKLIDSHKSLPESVYEIPPLGKYFREHSSEVVKIKNYRETKAKEMCGPLTQRLVAALVDDRVNNHHSNGTDSNDGFFVNRPGLVKALGLDGGIPGRPPLEARLRQVLLEQGLLQNDEDPTNPDDEILAEIKRTQNTLTKLHHYNSDKLKELLETAKKEHQLVITKNELDKADKEVVEAYRLITSCRQKKKPLTKKEKDTAARSLQNRKIVLDKLTMDKKVEG